MLLCGFCGYQNKNKSKFCTSCGNRLSDDSHVVGRIAVLGEAQEQHEYLVSDSERTIGRDPANEIVLDDDEASARHAVIRYTEQAYWIEDLGTTNGTFVNGERIGEPRRLADEDLIKMGRTLLKFRV